MNSIQCYSQDMIFSHIDLLSQMRALSRRLAAARKSLLERDLPADQRREIGYDLVEIAGELADLGLDVASQAKAIGETATTHTAPSPYIRNSVKQRIIDLYLIQVAGRRPTFEAIANRIGYSEQTVLVVLEEAGVLRKGRHLTETEVERIIQLYKTPKNNGGWRTTREIAEALNCSEHAVRNALATGDIPLRAKTDVPDALRQVIINLYPVVDNSGPKVAKHLKLPLSLVYRVLNEASAIDRRRSTSPNDEEEPPPYEE